MADSTAVPPVSEEDMEFNPGVKYAGMILLGLGLGGLALWLNPITLAELFATFVLPLMIVLALLASLGLVGRGFMELVNSKKIGEQIQKYLAAQQAQQAKEKENE